MVTRPLGSGALLLAGTLLGCGGAPAAAGAEEPGSADTVASAPEDAPTQGEPVEDPPPQEPADPAAEAVMRGHFRDVAEARDALVVGDLDAARVPLLRIASARYGEDMPSDWLRWVSEMQESAQAGAEEDTVAGAARRVAQLGGECGACHQDTRGALSVEATPLPERERGQDPVEAQMERHAFGVEQLWLGLTAPSYQAWARGVEALAADPGRRSNREARARVQALAERARDARYSGQRVRFYGELLSGCADCHREEGVGSD